MNSITKEHHSDEFKRKVAMEAYGATPSGGYPEVADKYGIEPQLVFDWVSEFFHPLPSPFSSVHVWAGTTTKSPEEFNSYFAPADDYWSIDVTVRASLDANATGCSFCIDLNKRYLYDDDLLYRQHFRSAIPVSEMVKELPLSTNRAEEDILKACERRGILSANAVISYADPEQTVCEPDKLYNGLFYLGLFRDRDA